MDCEAQVIAPIFMGSPTEINLCRLQDFILDKFLIPEVKIKSSVLTSCLKLLSSTDSHPTKGKNEAVKR